MQAKKQREMKASGSGRQVWVDVMRRSTRHWIRRFVALLTLLVVTQLAQAAGPLSATGTEAAAALSGPNPVAALAKNGWTFRPSVTEGTWLAIKVDGEGQTRVIRFDRGNPDLPLSKPGGRVDHFHNELVANGALEEYLKTPGAKGKAFDGKGQEIKPGSPGAIERTHIAATAEQSNASRNLPPEIQRTLLEGRQRGLDAAANRAVGEANRARFEKGNLPPSAPKSDVERADAKVARAEAAEKKAVTEAKANREALNEAKQQLASPAKSGGGKAAGGGRGALVPQAPACIKPGTPKQPALKLNEWVANVQPKSASAAKGGPAANVEAPSKRSASRPKNPEPDRTGPQRVANSGTYAGTMVANIDGWKRVMEEALQDRIDAQREIDALNWVDFKKAAFEWAVKTSGPNGDPIVNDHQDWNERLGRSMIPNVFSKEQIDTALTQEREYLAKLDQAVRDNAQPPRRPDAQLAGGSVNSQALLIDQMAHQAFLAYLYGRFIQEANWKPPYEYLSRQRNIIGYRDLKYTDPKTGKVTITVPSRSKDMTQNQYDAMVEAERWVPSVDPIQTRQPPKESTPVKDWKPADLE